MIRDFLKVTFWFFVIIMLGLGALSLTSYAAPYLSGLKAAIVHAFK